MVNHRHKGRISRINSIKEDINCILENGAYSDKNYQSQMNKKSDNYNEFEKSLVTISYRNKQFLGKKLQKEVFESLYNDKEFLDYLKINDIGTYEMIMRMKELAERL